MQYRKDQNGNSLSVLGFGCMRFTRKGSGLDIDKAEQEILAAFRAGVNSAKSPSPPLSSNDCSSPGMLHFPKAPGFLSCLMVRYWPGFSSLIAGPLL